MSIEFHHKPDGTIMIERRYTKVEFGSEWNVVCRLWKIIPCTGGAGLFYTDTLTQVFTSPESAITWAKENLGGQS